MTYAPGQFRHVVPHVSRPDWFILAGPADGDEAQCAVREWPGVKVIGLEPCHETREWQLHNGWPTPETLLPHALWDAVGTAGLHVCPYEKPLSDPECYQVKRVSHMRDQTVPDLRTVSTVTLDYLDGLYGPLGNVFLWADIEGAELRAFQGGERLFRRGAIRAVSVECLASDPTTKAHTAALHAFLTGHGMRQARSWGNDRVYVL